MNRRIALLGGAILVVGVTSAQAVDTAKAVDPAAAKVAVELCSACHGPAGSSVSPTFPRLAGQQEAYLAAQLRAFKSKERADPEAHDYMWGMAATVPDSLIDGLARYFASQPAPHGEPGNPALMAEGKKLFESGNPAEKIAACAGCHGAHGEGSSVFPRLAGQHAPYIARQLQVIQRNLRASPVMHGIITQLTPEEMNAVAEYVQSM